MNKLALAVHAVIGTTLVLGCASPPGTPKLEVRPVVSLQHGGAQADGYYELGRYYQGQNRIPDALDAYRKALALDDGLVEAHSALGTIYSMQGRYDDALAEFRRAIALSPGTARLHNNLGYALYLQGRQDEAIAEFERAVAIDPSNPRTWNNLGMAFAKGGETTRSSDAFARAAGPVAPRQPAAPAVDEPRQPSPSMAAAPEALAVPKDRGIIVVAPIPVEVAFGAGSIQTEPARVVAQSQPIVGEARVGTEAGWKVVEVPAASPSLMPAPSLEVVPAAVAPQAVEVQRVAVVAPVAAAQPAPITPSVIEIASPVGVASPVEANAAPIAVPMTDLPPVSTMTSIFDVTPPPAISAVETRTASITAPVIEVQPAPPVTVVVELAPPPASPAIEAATASITPPVIEVQPALLVTAVVELAPPPARPVVDANAASMTMPLAEAQPVSPMTSVGEVVPAMTTLPAVDARFLPTSTIATQAAPARTLVEIAPYVVELRMEPLRLWTDLVAPKFASDTFVAPQTAIGYRLEVSNGNGVTGMARKVGGLLKTAGLPRARLTNQKPFQQRVTEVQYRVGYELAAASLSSRLPNHPAIVKADGLRSTVDVRLVLGSDLPRNVALVEPQSYRPQLAEATVERSR